MNKSLRADVLEFAKGKYNTEPEYPWASAPSYAVLRHSDNKKWYGLIMDIPKNKFGIKSEETIDVINLKCDVILAGSLIMQEGIYPAYHMNKEKWISVFLDRTVDIEQIKALIDLSFELTKKNNGKK